MKKSFRRWGSLLAAALLITACRPNESVEGQARDAKIKTQVKSKLASDVGASTLTSVQVNVTNGVVTLAGPVHNADEKARAEAAARTVEGVVSVTNALQVLAPDTSATPPGATPAMTPDIATPPSATTVAVTPTETPAPPR
jgi:BON domain-containing protein